MHIIRTAQVTCARAYKEQTHRQTKFKPITSAETREGQGEVEDDEGRKDAPSVGAAIDGARQKNKTRRHAALQENGGRTPACNSTIRVPLTLCLLLWTRRRRWTLRPLKRRTYVDSHAGGERLHGKTASTRLVLGGARTTHHQTRLGRRPHDAPNGDRHAAEILRARLFPCPNRARGQCRLRRRTSATPMRINHVCSD